jgi:hypothetical protein
MRERHQIIRVVIRGISIAVMDFLPFHWAYPHLTVQPVYPKMVSLSVPVQNDSWVNLPASGFFFDEFLALD